MPRFHIEVTTIRTETFVVEAPDEKTAKEWARNRPHGLVDEAVHMLGGLDYPDEVEIDVFKEGSEIPWIGEE